MDEVPLRLQTLINSVYPQSAAEDGASHKRTSSITPNSPIRCAKALGNNIYVGCADGSLIRCTLRNDGPSTGDVYSVTSFQIVANKKPIDNIQLVPSVSKAMVLAGGIIYTYTLPSFDPVPSNVIPPLRGVASFCLDADDYKKDHYAPPKPAPPPTTGITAPWASSNAQAKQQLDPVSVYVFRDMKIGNFTLTHRLVPTKTEALSLERPPTHAVRSGRYICLADAEYYSIGDLEAKTQTLLAPVPEKEGEHPIVVYVQPGEFLIASPIGDTSLGVCLNGSAEPTREPIPWPAHPLSCSIDTGRLLSLLPDGTIQIHDLNGDASVAPPLLCTITLPRTKLVRPALLSFNPGNFLVPTHDRAHLVRFVKFTLLGSRPPPSLASTSNDSAPAVPQKEGDRQQTQTQSFLDATTLAIGAEGLQALVPPPFLARVERLLNQSRIEDAAKLTEPFPPGPIDMGDDHVIDCLYLFGRLALRCIRETMFDDAAEYLFHSRLDPRILIRLFPDLRGNLIGKTDTINIFSGLEPHLNGEETIYDIIMANLVRNYSSIKPSVQTAPSTVELNNVLLESARVMLMRYLRRVREARRGADGASSPNREVDLIKWRAVDTVYIKLLVETGQKAEVEEMLHSTPATIVMDEILPILRAHSFFSLLIEIYRQSNDEAKLLLTWSKIVEGEWKDPSVTNPLGEIIQLLSTSTNRDLVQRYGLWLARQEPVAAFSLFTSASGTMGETKRGGQPGPSWESTILAALRESSALVADQYLEYLVLNRNLDDRELHEELATKYIDALLGHLNSEDTVRQLTLLASTYADTPGRGPFLLYLATKLSSEARTARLKAALFLQGSTSYDAVAARKRLDVHKDLLLLERAILDGKLGNDRSALSLLAQLGDSISAEAYCTLGGEVIPGKVALQVAEIAHLEEWARLVAAPSKGPKRSKTLDHGRTRALLRILMEVYTHGGREAPSNETADLLNSQGVNLDVIDVLSSVPPAWSLSNISSFLTRSFRRSQHIAHEDSIIKGISWGQNLRVSDHAFTVIRSQGGVIEEPAASSSDDNDNNATGGEPSSFAEKDAMIIPGPEPVVGSVTTVDLARKEGFSDQQDENAGLV